MFVCCFWRAAVEQICTDLATLITLLAEKLEVSSLRFDFSGNIYMLFLLISSFLYCDYLGMLACMDLFLLFGFTILHFSMCFECNLTRFAFDTVYPVIISNDICVLGKPKILSTNKQKQMSTMK